MTMAKDPYRYFRVEARELLEGLTRGILALEKGDTTRELFARLMRLAHTLKGAARVVKQGEVADLAHEMEGILAPLRETGGTLASEQVSRLLSLVDACSEHLKPVLSPSEGAKESASTTKPDEAVTSLRAEVADVDALLYDLAEAAVRVGFANQETTDLDRSSETLAALVETLATPMNDRLPGIEAFRSLAAEAQIALRKHRRSLQTTADRTQHDLHRVRERVSDLRLLPTRELFAPLERVTRDAAQLLKKSVSFTTSGGEHRLDAHILLALRDALIQIVRNCVTHGIETEHERESSGKSREGHIRLQVSKRGGRVHFVVEDDGRGIDISAIRRVVINRRLATPAEAETLGMREATQLLFQGGVSTAPAVSEVMGRGVGLDIVRATVVRLKGDIELRCEPGRGTTIEIAVPVSLESLDVLAVAANGWTGLIPFDTVRRTLRLKESELIHSAAGTTLFWEGEAIPFRMLTTVLGDSISLSAREWTAVIVRARGGLFALGVDRLVGVRNVVVRPLPPLCGEVPLIASATLDAAGDPQLVLDPAGLSDAVRATTGRATPSSPPRLLSILVVDDSLTTRMLEQSILESAGYEVELATSAEEGLEKARQNPHAVFVVDVEMPGMNGFELLECFQADPLLARTPAILVTSRATPEDRQRGVRAGARAHIAKSAFDGDHLLSTIRQLTGEVAS